ncbi:MAG: 50S ribosomal protein L11 methyltransferase [Clostridiales bacterium]|nr:50S ribosomal protein L11 methyltransferase [Clostridiales bacterium]
MDWLELTVCTTTSWADLVSQLLMEAGSQGTMIRDRQDVINYQHSHTDGYWDLLDERVLAEMPEEVRVTGYYPGDVKEEEVLARVEPRLEALRNRAQGMDMGSLKILRGTLNEEDWAESWKKDFAPFRIGRHMVVKPGWCSYRPQPGDKILEMDPGMAFGTGTHETTALCAALLEELVVPGDTVIDVGTGTGILAIAAALCGAGTVLASDIDPLAVRIAAENIRRNNLSHVIRTRQGDLLQAVDLVGNVVVANIIAEVVASIAAPVRQYLVPGGYFICSGIAREKQEGVFSALNAAGYLDIRAMEKGEWAALCGRNP